MSMSDEGTGVARTPATDAPHGNAKSPNAGERQTGGASRPAAPPGNGGGASKALPGLAAFGNMQAYVPVAQPAPADTPEPADEDVAEAAMWQQHELYDSAEAHAPDEADLGQDIYEDDVRDGEVAESGLRAEAQAQFEANYGYTQELSESVDDRSGRDPAAEPSDEVEAFEERPFEEGSYPDEAYGEQSYAGSSDQGDFPGEGFSPEELQQYMAVQQAMEATAYGQWPEQEGVGDAGFEAESGAPDQATALQAFEARYDQHPEIALSGFDDLSDDVGAQPFFHEQGQEDADFMGLADEQMPPPRERRSRKMLIYGGGLLGALALGGALAFAYKTGDATQVADSGNPPLIQADKTPVKVAPAEPGGKTFPHKNKQIYDRLQGEQKPEVEKLVSREEPVAPAPDQPQTTASVDPEKTTPDTPAAPRKVRTLQVRPDGTIVPSAEEQTTATVQPSVPALPPPGDIPGITVTVPESPTTPVTTATVPKTPAAPALEQQPHQPTQEAPPQQPEVKPGQPEPAPPQVQATATEPTAPLPNPKPASPAQAPQPAPAAQDGGYVVQVASRRSQAMALAAFADLQQKYTKLLGNYQPLIQSADLGEKGVWYRLRVGPMDKKADAESLCKQLKNAGLRSCLVRPL